MSENASFSAERRSTVGKIPETPAQSQGRPTLAALTGLRFFAAFHVLLFHFGQPLFAQAPVWLSNCIKHGPVSVSLFFVLSGFILYYNYVDDLHAFKTTATKFWIARFARIYPVYLLGFVFDAPPVLYFLARTATPLVIFTSAATHLTLIQAWVLKWVESWNAPSWSLSCETFFYFCFPLLAGRIARSERGSVFSVTFALLCTELMLTLAYVMLAPPNDIGDRNGWGTMLASMPLLRLGEFVTGMLAAKMFIERSSAANALVAQRLWLNVRTLLPLSCILWILSLKPIQETIGTGPLILAELLGVILIPLFALLIYSLAHARCVVAALLQFAPVVILGEASYALYILHYPIMHWVRSLVGLATHQHPGAVITTLPLFLGYCLLCLGLSLVVFYWIEKPGRSYLMRWFASPGAARAGAGVIDVQLGVRTRL